MIEKGGIDREDIGLADGTVVLIPVHTPEKRLGHARQLEARLLKLSKHCRRVLCAPLASFGRSFFPRLAETTTVFDMDD